MQISELVEIFAEHTDIVFWVRTDSEMLYINEAYERVWGFSRKALYQNPNSFVELVHPEDLPELLDYLQSDKKQTPVWSMQYRLVLNSGEIRWFEVTNKLIDVEGRNFPGIMIGTAIDITQEKRISDKLFASEEKFRMIAENTSDGLLVFENNQVVYASPAYFKQLGYEEQEELGRDTASIADLLHPEDRDATLHSIQQAISRGDEELVYRFRAQSKQGDYIWREDHAKFVYDDNGNYVRAYVVARDVTDHVLTEQKIYDLAMSDRLTGLCNWFKFTQDYAMTKDDGGDKVFILLDLDGFRLINDTHGHHQGDVILKFIGSRLKKAFPDAKIARYGGDEFVLLFNSITDNQKQMNLGVEFLAQSILSEVARPFRLYDRSTIRRKYSLTAGIGVMTFKGYIPLQEVFRLAEIALYNAKHRDKNQFAIYDEQMQQCMLQKVTMEEQLARALVDKELEIYFQPQFDLQHRCVAFECLLRWFHPQDGWIAPDQFIPIAEQMGMIVVIERWVIQQVCGLLQSKVFKENRADLSASINISSYHFLQEDFESNLLATVKEAKVDCCLIVLELTESLLISQKELVSEKMARLKPFGFRFSLDDFGTGYSSLSYLKNLSFDQVKIDKSFINSMSEEAKDLSVVKAIVALAKALELELVAEGVESEAQQAILADLRCDLLQGYLFSKPIPKADFINKFVITKG
ncbi:EAL domain-containing protein [Thiomicrorhabdus indica]|uniref:bifunctional diguanylate cyclase/phosphodiesterase n=1 Tax=Thiomicrorhabdus indica TaxID=2267253 RepID=UPI002AA8EDD8|nr:EAL domain-containing protein [Thiomicrorhabdus indica]